MSPRIPKKGSSNNQGWIRCQKESWVSTKERVCIKVVKRHNPRKDQSWWSKKQRNPESQSWKNRRIARKRPVKSSLVRIDKIVELAVRSGKEVGA